MEAITTQKSAATGTTVLPYLPTIRADCTQLGLSIEASKDDGKTWHFVQLTPYTTRSNPSVRQYSTCVNPAQDREDYFAELDRRGILYKRARIDG